MISSACAKLLVLFVLANAAYAQATGTLLGVVSDSSKATIAGSTIKVTNEATGTVREASSGATGEFLIPRLPAGRYTVHVEAPGFRTFENRGVIVPVDQSVTLQVAMQLGTVNEVVTVSGTASMLQTNSATLSQVVEQRRIEELPLNGRNVLHLIRLNAGVVSRGAGGSGQFQIAGAAYASANSVSGTRGNQTGFLLDGGNNTSGIVNGANPTPSPDAVQQFSIQGNNFSAEYGNVAGGVVNVVTRSGTNTPHRSVFDLRLHCDSIPPRKYGVELCYGVTLVGLSHFGVHILIHVERVPELVRHKWTHPLQTRSSRAGMLF